MAFPKFLTLERLYSCIRGIGPWVLLILVAHVPSTLLPNEASHVHIRCT